MVTDSVTRERVEHLFDYLSALAQEVYAKPVRHIGEHDLACAPDEVPAHQAVRVGAAAGDAWLRVAKTSKPIPPAMPPELKRHCAGVILGDPHRRPVEPADLAVRVGPPTEEEPDPVRPVRVAFARWVDDVWEPWAELARTAVAARTLYESLFQLRQRVRADEATHELVWGHGILGWNFGEQRICHPMVVSRVKVVFDEENGELSVTPEGLPELELDCLQGLGVPNLGELLQVQNDLRAEGFDPWDARADVVYRKIIAPLGLDTDVRRTDELPPVGASPEMSVTWRLFVRKRRVMFLRFFDQLKNALGNEDGLPAPVVALAAGEGAARGVHGEAEERAWAPVAEQLLMPLPANAEQEQIARKLARHSGVTVQGPPGTGKSHTIANLVSHLVAHGKRVLVTAHKDQALAVLRDKIPAELRDLSLAVLGSSSADMTALQRSVQAITEAADNVDEHKESAATERLRGRLDEIEAEVLRLRKRLRLALEREQDVLELNGRQRRAAELAEWLADNDGELNRIPDRLPLGAASPLTSGELGELYSLAGRIDAADAAACASDLPPTHTLPSGADLARELEELRRIAGILRGYDDYVADPSRLDTITGEALEELATHLSSTARWIEPLEQDWLARLRSQIVQDTHWMQLWAGHTARLRADARMAADLRARLSGCRVELPPGRSPREIIALLQQALQRFREGRKVSGLTQRNLAQFLGQTSIDGERPTEVEDIEKMIAWVELGRLRAAFTRLWQDELVVALAAPPVPEGVPAPETWIDARCQEIESALSWESRFWPDLRTRIGGVVSLGMVPVRPSSADLHRLAEVLGALRARARQRQLEDGRARFRQNVAEARQRPGASLLWGELLTAYDEHDTARWDTALATSARLAMLRPQVERMNELTRRLTAVTPLWTRKILELRGDPSVCGDPGDLPRLWEWRQSETWLRDIINADDLAEVQRRLDTAQEEQRRVTLELTRRSAWLAMKRNLGHTQRQALVGWLQTLRKIGKGTGRGAAKWRAEAQKLMPQAMGAVPVWIMPYYRVAESFDPTVAPLFDVVIVDESSQCDVFALGLLGLGRKVVVVGDDKQISPSAVGVRQERVDELIRTHLPSFPNALLLDLGSSLYDASARLFPGVVRLREHFRCLPRIIEFSSQHYYGGEIQALREEAPGKLPGSAVEAVHVPDGVRRVTGFGDINEAEAAALVDKVVQCCADPAYDGRTMGVISLLGRSRQAQWIDQALLAKLGPEAYEQRRLRCGDSYSFQGDERDIVFITTVIDSGGHAFTGKTYEQRVNVAASRARDQMWIFHSVTADRLNPDDQRGRLIRYATDGQRSADLTKDLEDRCDSDFERRVLRMLLARDYLVTPQHPVGNLRIDLVVRGNGRRLAIECDGDKFHGPDQWEDDLRRQSVLERMGWRFWRVRGSVFYRDPASAMDSLWPLLTSMGITPGPEPEPDTPDLPEMPIPVPAVLTEPAPTATPAPAQEPAASSSRNDPDLERVREWARRTGRYVNPNGRVAPSIIADYNWEHPETPYPY
ncbi:AAA domain-containing protein [Actinomadura craniellae]|uniref:AAA domain-containing protein n=1 Tax=Actinomadura craniellae TaxID=2231787 RepID=UPI0011BD480B|nr:AAA domain-containing protein [Actinomadura craniellae]